MVLMPTQGSPSPTLQKPARLRSRGPGQRGADPLEQTVDILSRALHGAKKTGVVGDEGMEAIGGRVRGRKGGRIGALGAGLKLARPQRLA